MATHDAPSCCGGTPAVPVQTNTLPLAKVLMLRIDKMDCPTEEALIQKKLGKLDGVEALEFNLMQRRLTIRHQLQDAGSIIEALTQIGLAPTIEAVATPTPAASAASSVVVFIIDNMDCPTEEGLIRAKFAGMSGINRLDFNLLQRKLTVSHSLESPDSIRSTLVSIGMHAVDAMDESGVATIDEVPMPASHKNRWLLGTGAISAISAEVIAWNTGNEQSWLVIALALLAICCSGVGTYKKGWIALRNFNLNINALMAIAVTGAMLIGQWPEAAMVMVLFAAAEMIEALSLDRARHAIRSLMALTPDTATVLQPDGSWSAVNAASILIGDTARVGPGERIAVDGQLLRGQSSVNQAPITGESLPVAKEVGDKVFAGTINESGSFEYTITARQTDSTLARIIRAVEDAQGSRAPTQRFVDRFAKIYTPIVFIMALAVAIIPPLAFGLPWLAWLYKALVLLVIACPCALVLSTPVTIVSGLAGAARRGILIKGGVYLEEGYRLKVLALDKTGTITQGKPIVTDLVALKGDPNDALRFASSLSARSNHPVSTAVTAHWTLQNGAAPIDDVSDFEAISGRGVKGMINHRVYYLGNHRLMEEHGACSPATEALLQKLEAEGKTAIVIFTDSGPLAIIAVADTVRQSSRQAIAELHALGVRTLMLTGDNDVTAQAIARSVGIDNARGNMLPEDKLAVINSEVAKDVHVGMVGDGVNDAPALAKASIGFAMGAAGSDTALETADVALMNDDLRKIPEFIRISRNASRILKQNILIALSIKAVFLGLAIAGMATLWMAVFADMGASLIVVFNGLRLLGSSLSESSDKEPIAVVKLHA